MLRLIRELRIPVRLTIVITPVHSTYAALPS